VGGHREDFDDDRQNREVVVEWVGSSLAGGGEEHRTMKVDREIVLEISPNAIIIRFCVFMK
jgi:hypothetical protein